MLQHGPGYLQRPIFPGSGDRECDTWSLNVDKQPLAIFAEAGLSFLGLGINPPTPSWGQMVSSHLPNVIYYWHLALFPVFMIALVMLGFSLIGDGLRDALDPRMNE